MNRSLLRAVTLCTASLSFAAGAITMTMTTARGQGVVPQGQAVVPQGPAPSPQYAAPRPQDPILHDPVLLRNCQVEYDQATKSLGGAASPQELTKQMSNTSVSNQVMMAENRNELFLRKIECKSDQENRKLDYLLGINGVAKH